MAGFLFERVTPERVDEIVALFAREVYPGDAVDARAHFDDHRTGGGDSFLAFVDGALAGYVTIRWQSHNDRFRAAGIPLIHHLAVFEPFQRQGIASRLMDAAEALIATRATAAGITVGLFDAYGPAQRLYARRGYVPDGRGACLSHRPLRLGETVTIDHDLLLWLTKYLAAPEPVTLRTETQPGDLGEIIRFHAQVYAAEYGFDTTFEAYVAAPLARFVVERTERDRLWIAERGGQMVGCIALVRVADDEAQLRWFLVDPSARGTGLGRRLLTEALAFADRAGYQTVFLWTVSAMTAARHLYRSVGFRLEEEHPRELWGASVVEERYRRP